MPHQPGRGRRVPPFPDPDRPAPDRLAQDRLSQLLAVGACWNAAVSPDGRAVAFLSEGLGDGLGRPQLFLSPLATWTPRQVTAGDASVVDLAWSADGGLIGYTVAPGGGGRTQLHVVDADGRAPRPMFVAHEESAFAGTWTRDGRGFAFSTTLGCSGTACSAYLLDLRESTLLPLGRGEPADGRVLVTDVAPDRRRTLLRTGPPGRHGSVLVDRTVARRVPLVDPTGQAGGSVAGGSVAGGSVDQARFDADGGRVFVRTDVGREFCALGVLELDLVGEPGPLQIVAGRDDAGLDLFALSGDRSVGVLVWNVAGSSVVELWDPATGARRPVPLPFADGLGVVGDVSLDEAGTVAILDLSGPRQPQSLYRLDPRDGTVTPLGPAPGGVGVPAPLVLPTSESYRADDGVELCGWLYRSLPPSGRESDRTPGPVVVCTAGGPGTQQRPVWSALHQSLLDAGLSVFTPDVRGCSGHGRTFRDGDVGGKRPAAVGDLAAAVRHLVERGVAVPGRVGILGSSSGGYLALAGIGEFPDLFAAAVDVGGIANLETWFAGTTRWLAEAGRAEYGDPRTDAALLRRLSPVHRLHRTRTPTLVVHGVQDREVPLRESEQVVDALRAHHVPVELLLLPDEGSDLRGRAARQAVTHAALDWFRRHLAPGPDGDPG